MEKGQALILDDEADIRELLTLTLHIPKRAEVRPRKVEVRVA